MRVPESLVALFDYGVLEEVIRPLMSGADVMDRVALRMALAAFDGKGSPERLNSNSIGSRLKGYAGRIVDGRKLEVVGKQSPRRYRVGVVGFVGVDTAGANTRVRVAGAEGRGPTNPTTPTAREPGEEG